MAAPNFPLKVHELPRSRSSAILFSENTFKSFHSCSGVNPGFPYIRVRPMIAEPIFPKNYEKLHKIKDIKVFFWDGGVGGAKRPPFDLPL